MTAMQSDWLAAMHEAFPRLALGYRYEVQLGKMLDEKQVTGEHLRPYLRNVDVQWGRINTEDLPRMDFEEKDRQRFALRRGDILVCEGGEVGRAAEWEGGPGLEEVYYQKALHRLRPWRPDDEHPRYMLWCLYAAAAQNAFADGGKSTIAHLPADAFRRIRFPKPRRAQQERIANFLDEQTARIDALIAEKEVLVERLIEFSMASVTSKVLGLDLPGERVPVNVPEVGSIPSGWALVPMMRLTEPARPIMYGIVLPGPNIEEGPAVPIVKGGDVRPHRLKRELLNCTTPEIEAPYARARLASGDIVYSIRGTIGDAELVPAELAGANITQDVARIAPRAGLDARWLLYAAKSRPVFAQLEQLSLGAAVRGINIYDLKRARVPTPPLEAQTRIADALDSLLRRTEALRGHAVHHIDRLREFRSSLISAAVTGQLDISTFQAKTPEVEAA